MATYIYIDNTHQDTRPFHGVIMAAILAGGEFGEDYSDIFKLTKAADGSAAEWVLDMADDTDAADALKNN